MLDELFKAMFKEVFKLVAEVVIRLPGYGLLRLAYRKDEIDPDGLGTFSVGCLFWLQLLAVGSLLIWWLQD